MKSSDSSAGMIKFYKSKKLPIDFQMKIGEHDRPSEPARKIPNILEIIKESSSKNTILKTKNSALASLQKQYRCQIERLQARIEQLRQKKSVKSELDIQETKKIFLLSIQVDRLRKFIIQNQKNLQQKQQEKRSLIQKHVKQINDVRTSMQAYAKQELKKLKDQFQKCLCQMRQQYQLEVLQVQKKQIQYLNFEKQFQELKQVEKQNYIFKSKNHSLKIVIKDKQAQIKHLNQQLAISLHHANLLTTKIRQSVKTVQQKRSRTFINQLNQTQTKVADLQKQKQFQNNQYRKSSITSLQQKIQLLQIKNSELEAQLSIMKQINKLQPRSNKKDQSRRGDESLQISLQNSNLNDKQKQLLKIEEYIKQMKSRIDFDEQQLKLKNQKIMSLQFQVDNLTKRLQQSQKLIQFKNKKLEAFTEDTSFDTHNQIQQLKDIISQKDKKIQMLESNFAQINSQKQKQMQELQSLLRNNSKKLAKKQEDYQNIKAEYDTMKQMFEHQLKQNLEGKINNND